MPSIDIHHKHGQSLKQAREAVKKAALAIGQKFDIKSEWNGNTLNFERPGATGKIHVAVDEIHITAQLGFLIGTLKPLIEKEIERALDNGLSSSAK